jgi:uncharacterized cupredoxin-like copper-binding protein
MWFTDAGRVSQAGLITLTGLALAACGGSTSGGTNASQAAASASPPAAPSAAPSVDVSAPPLSFHVDAAGRTVSFHLVAAHSQAESGFNFNGYGSGGLAITVPEGWQVSITCENRGPLNHSCAIVRGPADSQPALAGASTPNPVSGQPAGTASTFAFTAVRQGSYRIACLVPGHEQAGMWDTFTITGAGSQPTARAGP